MPLDDNQTLTLWVAATRYYLPRKSYAVSDYTQMLAGAWLTLPERTREIVTRDVDEAFALREGGSSFAVGIPEEWGKVRACWQATA